MPFFNWHYNRADKETGLDIAGSIGISHDDLRYVTRELLSYMRGKRDSLEGITAEVSADGGLRAHGENFFSEREIRHMLDVKALYNLLFIIRNVAFFLLIAIILGMLLADEKPLCLLARCSREVLAGFLGVALIMTVIISVDFKRSWDIFHHIFFRGEAADYWRLTPFIDLMINLFPLRFFLGISVFFATLIAFFSATVITSGSVYLHLNRDRFSRL